MMASRRPPAPPRPPPPRMPVPSTPPRSIRLRQQTRLDRSKAQSKRRLGRPAELRKKIKRAPPTEKTVDGLPASWGELRKGETRRRLDDFVRDREPDQRAYVGVDLGVRNPVAAYLSIPTSVPGMVDGRAEASVVYRRDTLLAMQRRNSSMMSHINTNLRRQVDLSRTASTSRTSGRDDGTADDEATDEQATIDMWVNVLTKAHPVRERTQIRYAVEREAEMRRFTSELARAMAGGNEGRSRAELAELRWVVFVGDEMNEATGASGAQSHNVILRHLPIELRRRGMQAMFVRTPESYTSQRCPHPRCRRDDREGRSVYVGLPQVTSGERSSKTDPCSLQGIDHEASRQQRRVPAVAVLDVRLHLQSRRRGRGKHTRNRAERVGHGKTIVGCGTCGMKVWKKTDLGDSPGLRLWM